MKKCKKNKMLVLLTWPDKHVHQGGLQLFCNPNFDLEKSRDGIVHFYNQSGLAEKEFDILKIDFGW